MRKLKKAGLTLLITSVFLSNNAMYAFADEVPIGPGYVSESALTEIIPLETGVSEEYSYQYGPGAPQFSVESTVTDPTEAETSTQVPETDPTEAETSAQGPETDPTETPAGSVTETAQPIEDNNPLSVPGRVPRLQTTVLIGDLGQWSSPFVNDQTVTADNHSFQSISTFLEGIHGDLLYRTYSTSGGWTGWRMNGQQSELKEGWPAVEAIQFRFAGPVADQYDIYYTASLSDGSSTSWAKNGATCGTMNQGLTMTGFRLAFFEKGSETGLDMSNPVRSAHADGIQYIDGVMRYIHGDGSGYTGWGWLGEDRYYFTDSYPVTGWQYIDGYKYYFGEDGKMWTDLEPLVGTAGPFHLKINKEMNCLTVYAKDGANGFIIPVKSFLVSTGEDTPLGTFKTPEKYRWRLMINDVYTQYATRLGSGLPILMHSIIYDRPDPYTVWASTYNNLGIARSAGCIRLTTADSKWIYDNCVIGTSVEVYESPVPGPYERPTIASEIPFEQTWDPTDPNVTAEGIAAATAQILAAKGV